MLAGRILAGGLLLVFGRKLFWLFVAIIGFATGLAVASRFFPTQPEWLQLLIGVAFGLVGAVLAQLFQEVAIAVAGFLAGGYIGLSLVGIMAGHTAPSTDTFTWIVFIVSGLIGAALAFMLFDWALILLSSVAGALLVTEGLKIVGPTGWLVAAGLFVLGVIIQSRMERPPRPERRRAASSD